MGDGTFVFTNDMDQISNRLWEVTSIVGAGVCFFILFFVALLYLHPQSRPHLDRVSFRIMLYALAANLVFAITNAIGGSFTGPSWSCGFTIFLLQFTLELSCFLIFTIAMNLQLVIVHRMNSVKLEKYHILGSIAISLCITIPPYAAGQYGWDHVVEDCWYANDNPKQRLAWQIGSQLAWTFLTVVGEVFSSLIVVIYMIRHRIMQRMAHPTPYSSRLGTSATALQAYEKNRHLAYAHAYRNIIYRIGLYPMASCIINLTSIMCVIHATVEDGVKNMTGYRIVLLSDFLYGGRAIVYSLLAASDPAVIRALQNLINFYFRKDHPASDQVSSSYPSAGSNSVRVELTTIRFTDTNVTTDADLGKSEVGLPVLDIAPIHKGPQEDNIGMDKSRDDLERAEQDTQLQDRLRQKALERKQDQDDFKRQI